jgi:uncharacterized protein HemX
MPIPPITTADIIQFAGTLVALIVAISGWYINRQKAKKMEAETLQLYSEMVNDGTKREKEQREEIEKLRTRIEAQDRKLEAQNRKILELQDTINQKDRRIEELETLTHDQEAKIKSLRSELEVLKLK